MPTTPPPDDERVELLVGESTQPFGALGGAELARGVGNRVILVVSVRPTHQQRVDAS